MTAAALLISPAHANDQTLLRVVKLISRALESPMPAEKRAALLVERAKLYSDLDRPEARSDLMAAMAVNRHRALAFADQCWVNVASGRIEVAIRNADLMLAIFPNNIDGRHCRSAARFTTGDLTGALDDLDAIVASGTATAQHQHDRGVLLAAVGRYADAEISYSEALRHNTEIAEWYHGRALARFYLREFRHSIDDLNQALRLKPNWPLYLGDRCIAWAFLAEAEPAAADCQEALATNHSTPSAMIGTGLVRLLHDDPGGAVQQFERTLVLHPHLWQVRAYMATALERLGETERAETELERSRLEAPSVWNFTWHVGEARRLRASPDTTAVQPEIARLPS